MTHQTLSPAEIEARVPVWDAIADLFLDTEIDAATRERIARALAGSPFSVDELHRVYLYEVAPVVHRNLKIVAGAWAGFGEEWLRERIPAYLDGSRLYRWWSMSRIGRWWHTTQTAADWEMVIRHVSDLRARG